MSLTAAINTTSAQGRLVFTLFASRAGFERKLMREHPYAWLAAARGRVGGGVTYQEEAERSASIAEMLYREQRVG